MTSPIASVQKQVSRHYPGSLKRDEIIAHCLVVQGESSTEQEKRRSMDILVKSHLPWIFSLAKPYMVKWPQLTQEFFQDAVAGFAEAVKRYDPEKARITSYSVWWVRDSLIRCAHQMIRNVIPYSNRSGDAFLISAMKEGLSFFGDYSEAIRFVSLQLKVDGSKLNDVWTRYTSSEDRLDEPVSREDGSATKRDFLLADNDEVEESVHHFLVSERVRNAADSFAKLLDGRDLHLWRNRIFPAPDVDPAPLRRTGELWGATREAARLWEKDLLRRFRQYLQREGITENLF